MDKMRSSMIQSSEILQSAVSCVEHIGLVSFDNLLKTYQAADGLDQTWQPEHSSLLEWHCRRMTWMQYLLSLLFL